MRGILYQSMLVDTEEPENGEAKYTEDEIMKGLLKANVGIANVKTTRRCAARRNHRSNLLSLSERASDGRQFLRQDKYQPSRAQIRHNALERASMSSGCSTISRKSGHRTPILKTV